MTPIDRVLASVASKHGLDPATVRDTRQRSSAIVRARHEWWRLVIDSWGLSFHEASFLLRVDHTSLMHALGARRRQEGVGA